MVPAHLADWWRPELWCLRSAGWWQSRWERTGILDIEVADTLPLSWHYWLAWQAAVAPHNHLELSALEADQGAYLGYVRLMGRRRENIQLEEPIVSIPAHYSAKPLLRT